MCRIKICIKEEVGWEWRCVGVGEGDVRRGRWEEKVFVLAVLEISLTEICADFPLDSGCSPPASARCFRALGYHARSSNFQGI